MAAPPELEYARARALRGRAPLTPPGFKPPDEILDSWARCLDHGLDYAASLRLPVVSAGELAARRDSAATVRRLARAELETLLQQIAGSNYLLAFADADGVVLDVLADNRFAMNCDEDIVTGSCWREDVAGTNGLGTALAAGCGVAVTGAEHYFLRLADISCTASPIRDADGRIVGLLDASSYVKERQRHTLALVQMSTAHIENVLLAEQCAGDLLLAIHPRREFLRTLGAGILALDGQGVLRALNARARALLAGLPAERGTPFETLFGERFSSFVARLHTQGEASLRDALGSVLLARCVGPRPALVVPAGAAPAPAPPAVERFVADDPRVAAALRTLEQALRHGLPTVLRGPPGSGKKRLVREALRGRGRDGALAIVPAAGLDAAGVQAALALLDTSEPGALVLHEVDRLGSAEQATLLRALDERRQQGRATPLVTTLSTGADAAALVQADLFYRLASAEVHLPALRERSDFAACARQALDEAARKAHLDVPALDLLAAQSWPGNWRELQSVLARAAMAALATAAHAQAPLLIEAAQLLAYLPPSPRTDGEAASVLHREATERVRRELERQGGSVSATARRLGVSRNTVYRHLRETKASKPHGG